MKTLGTNDAVVSGADPCHTARWFMKKSHPTILVVDDSEDDQFLIKYTFKKIGVTDPIHVVSDGSEAIAYMMGEGKFADRTKFAYPTFIMTDLKMPKRDGFAVLEFLKSNPEWAVIPTIVFSASTDLDDIKKAYMLGASSYHVKPRTHGAMMHQMLVLHAYWLTCEVPEVDMTGRQLQTESSGKLGERFPQAGQKGGAKKANMARKSRNKSGNGSDD